MRLRRGTTDFALVVIILSESVIYIRNLSTIKGINKRKESFSSKTIVQIKILDQFVSKYSCRGLNTIVSINWPKDNLF